LNYETFRAIYEGREAKMFKPATGVIIWMSNPAQPSFVWQIYHHDLEPNAALFAAREACEPVHIMMNEKTGNLVVINNHPEELAGAKAHVTIFNLDSSVMTQNDVDVKAVPSAATDLGPIALPANLSPVYFMKLELRDADGKLISDNFYWRSSADPDNLQDLNKLPTVTLEATATRKDAHNKCLVHVTLRNPGSQIAVMAHVQLRRDRTGGRVLPVFYSDNYISLAPSESGTIDIEAPKPELKGEKPLIAVDGWNIAVKSPESQDVSVVLNENAQVNHWPETGLPIVSSAH
jgi:beta-mannosidase